MSRKLDIVSGLVVALTVAFTLFSADGSGAVAQSRIPVPVQAQATSPQAAGPLAATGDTTQNLPSAAPASQESALLADDTDAGLSLAELVAGQNTAGELSRNLECLAGAIYFEAKSESLEGQLAVGRVVVNRARSGRFPASYCGVVFQRSQFSFVRGNGMPAINRASRDWKEAVAIAQIAHDGSWSSVAEGALFFHATRVSPNWRLTRIARVDNHVFYR